MIHSREGEQLELDGVGGVLARSYVRVAWDGTSPRALTEGYKRFTLKAQAKKSVSDPRQYELFEEYRDWGDWLYPGAPLLLPLPP